MSLYDALKSAFRDVLIHVRQERGQSPEEFARQLDMDIRTYMDIESGEWGPTLWFVFRIANGIGCQPEELVTATRERMPVNQKDKKQEPDRFT